MNRDQKAVAIAEIAAQHRRVRTRSSRSTIAGSPCPQVAELRAKTARRRRHVHGRQELAPPSAPPTRRGAESAQGVPRGPHRVDVRAWWTSRNRRQSDRRLRRARRSCCSFKGGRDGRLHARRRAAPLALAPALPRRALRPARRRRRLARPAGSCARSAALVGGLASGARPGAATRRSPESFPPATRPLPRLHPRLRRPSRRTRMRLTTAPAAEGDAGG